jgi:arylsulfatase A-like enzyme
VEPGVVVEPVGLADVVPTQLAALGLPPNPVEPDRKPRSVDLFSHNNWRDPLSSLVSGDLHAIYRHRSREFLVFDWRADPLEQRDLAGQDRVLDRSLQARVFAELTPKRHQGRLPYVSIEPPNSGQRDRLRALGYVE